LRSDIAGGQGQHVDVIPVRLEHCECPMRKHVIIGMGTNQQDSFSGPLLDRRLWFLFPLLSGGRRG